MDIIINRRGKYWGFEVKYADAPSVTKSMSIAKTDLDLKHVWVVYPGSVSYNLAPGIDCISLKDLAGVINKELKRI